MRLWTGRRIFDNMFRIKTILLGVVILLACSAAYVPAMRAGFIWDDDWLLTRNARITDPGGEGLYKFWLTLEQTDYYPVTWSSLWLEWRAWKDSATGYHIVNIVLHGLGAVLLWRVVGALGIPGAWLIGLIWALHPVNVASVAWISELKNTLSLIFFLLTVLFYLRFDERQAGRWYALSLAMFLLALLSKTSVVMAPVVLLLCLWWRRRQLGGLHWLGAAVVVILGALYLFNEKLLKNLAGQDLPPVQFALILLIGPVVLAGGLAALLIAKPWRDALRKYPALMTAPFFLLSVYYSLLTIWTQKHTVIQQTRIFGEGEGFFWRLACAGMAPWFYLYKALLPVKLVMIYPRWDVDPSAIQFYLPGLVLIGLVGLFWWYRKSWGRPLFFMLAYMLVTLFPVLGFFEMYYFLYAQAADHWQYMGIIGVISLVVGAAWHYLRMREIRVRAVAAVLAGCLVVALGVLTYRQAETYDSQLTLWRDNIATYPTSWMPYFNLGRAVDDQLGDTEKALSLYKKSLELNPKLAKSYNNIGSIYAQDGRLEEALSYYSKGLELQPWDAMSHSNIGVILARKGERENNPQLLQKGLAELEKALELDPRHFNAYMNLALLYIDFGRFDEATRYCDKALELWADNPEVHYIKGKLLTLQKRPAEAVKEYREALRLRDDYVEAHMEVAHVLLGLGMAQEAAAHFSAVLDLPLNRTKPSDRAIAHDRLGVFLAEKGRHGQAVEHFEKAIRLVPGEASFYSNLGLTLFRLGYSQRAIALYNKAVQLDPNSTNAHDNLAIALTRLGQFDEAIYHYRKAVELDPNRLGAIASLAWLLATHPLAERRDGEEALALAQRACQQTGYGNPGPLNSLAAAYAELGRFDQAVQAAERALDLAKRAGDQQRVAEVSATLDSYRSGRPYRIAPPSR